MKKILLIFSTLVISLGVSAQSEMGAGATDSQYQGNKYSREPYSIRPGTDPFPQKKDGQQRMEENSRDKSPSTPLQKQKIKGNHNSTDMIPYSGPSGTSTITP